MRTVVSWKVDGMVVKALPLAARTKTTPGDKLTPGDLLLELNPRKK